MTLVRTNDSKEIIKIFEELWSKIIDLIRSITKNSDDYDEKYRKIRFDSDDDLPVNETIKIHNVTMLLEQLFMKITNIIQKFS